MTKKAMCICLACAIVGTLCGAVGGLVVSSVLSAKFNVMRDTANVNADRLAWTVLSQLCDNVLETNTLEDLDQVKKRAQVLRDVASLEITFIDSMLQTSGHTDKPGGRVTSVSHATSMKSLDSR